MTVGILVAVVLVSAGWSWFQPKPDAGSRWVHGVVLLIVFAAAAGVGAMLGFLFGLPRARATDPLTTTDPSGTATVSVSPGRHYLANSNLIKVSDWLTTIVIGLTLVNLGKVVPAARTLAGALEEPLGGTPAAPVVGLASIVFGALAGFMLMYLYVSIRIRELLEDSENAPVPMPTFVGLTVAQARQLAAELSIALELPPTVAKDDVVTDQVPAPGVMVHAEKRVYAVT